MSEQDVVARHSEIAPSSPLGSPPVRGTQSLVGVLTFVWEHPSLTALELLWRWLAAIPLLALLWYSLWPSLQSTPLDSTALASMTFFEPVRSVAVLAGQLRVYLPACERTGRWWVPCALLFWSLAAGLGRTAVLRRASPGLRPRPLAMTLFSLLRCLCFVALLALWSLGLLAAVHATITYPAQRGGDPNLVLLTALAVALTLAAFLLWSLLVWALDLAPLQAMEGAGAGNAGRPAELRSKLIETNLVMGIVRVILLVLTLTFSASPLPFQSQETQAYINVWWVATAMFYVLSSDFFHVVRRVTYLRLLETVAQPTNVAPANAS